MKQLLIMGLGVLALVCSVFAEASDPVADYKNKQGLTATDIIYRWTADIDGDGKNEVFLTLKEEYQDEKNAGQMPSWFVYLAKHDGSGYSLSTGEEYNGVTSLNPVSAIDPDKVYIGQITQLGKRGLVTIQVDLPQKSAPVAYIYAYTIVSDHLKKTLLVKYNFDDENAIYDQYLKDGKRTPVTLQEVTP